MALPKPNVIHFGSFYCRDLWLYLVDRETRRRLLMPFNDQHTEAWGGGGGGGITLLWSGQ